MFVIKLRDLEIPIEFFFGKIDPIPCSGLQIMGCEAELSKLDMSDINFQNNTTNEFDYQLFNSEGWCGQSIHRMN